VTNGHALPHGYRVRQGKGELQESIGVIEIMKQVTGGRGVFGGTISTLRNGGSGRPDFLPQGGEVGEGAKSLL